MAKVVVEFQANVDGFQAELKKAEQSVFGVEQKYNESAKKITQSTKEVGKGIKDTFNGKSLDAFIKEATRSNQTVGELKKSLRELKTASLNVKEGTKEFQQLTKAAGELQDKIGDINQRIKNLASDTQRLDALLNIGQGIAGGFSLAQGSLALFGAESEDLQKTLVKLQATQNILNGLQQVANVLNKDSAASIFLSTGAQRAYSLAVGTSTGALKAFRLALIATGIGAALVAIGALVAYWKDLSNWIDKTSEKLGENATKVKVLVGVLFPLVGVILLIKGAIDKFGESSESLSEKLANQSNKLKEQIAVYEAAGRSSKDIIALKKEELKVRAKSAMLISDEKKRSEELNAIRIEYIGLLKENKEEEKKNIEDLEKKRKEAWEKEWERIKKRNELLEAQKEFDKATFEDIIKLQEEARLKLAEIPLQDEHIIEENTDAVVYAYQKSLQGQLDLLQAFRDNSKNEYEQGIINYEEYQKRLTEINSKEVDLRNLKRDTELQVATQVTTSLLALNEFILGKSREAAEIGKALALFQIGIDTAVAISTITKEMAKGNLTPIEYALKVAGGIAVVSQNMLRAKNLLNSDVPQFADGTERVKGGRKGVDSVPAILMPDEAVIKAKENMRYFGLSKAWNAGKLEDYISDKWVLPALIKQKQEYENSQQKTFANNIAQSLLFNDKNLIKAHKAGMRTQWETTEYLATVIKKSKRNPYSPL